jgi:hypothetical protein
VTPERGDLGGGDAGQPEAPVLRIGQIQVRGEGSGKLRACQKSCAPRLSPWAGAGCSFRRTPAARRRTRPRARRDPAMLVVEHRQGRGRRRRPNSAALAPCVVTLSASSGCARVELGDRGADEVPQRLDVVVRVGAVGLTTLGVLRKAISVRVSRSTTRELGVRLADVDDADGAGAPRFLPGTTPSAAS